MPVTSLSDAAPVYERPFVKRAPVSGTPAFDAHAAADAIRWSTILAAPDMCLAPLDLGAVRLHRDGRHGAAAGRRRRRGARARHQERRLPSPPTCTPRYCRADPYEGGKQAVAEAWRNLTAVGATPLAVTDNLNFGNPQKPEIMGEIVAGIEGIGEACRALDFPGHRRQLLALQRDQRRRHPADARHRRRRPAEGRAPHGDHRASSGEGDVIILIGETTRPSRPVDLSARDRRPRRRRARRRSIWPPKRSTAISCAA